MVSCSRTPDMLSVTAFCHMVLILSQLWCDVSTHADVTHITDVSVSTSTLTSLTFAFPDKFIGTHFPDKFIGT